MTTFRTRVRFKGWKPEFLAKLGPGTSVLAGSMPYRKQPYEYRCHECWKPWQEAAVSPCKSSACPYRWMRY